MIKEADRQQYKLKALKERKDVLEASKELLEKNKILCQNTEFKKLAESIENAKKEKKREFDEVLDMLVSKDSNEAEERMAVLFLKRSHTEIKVSENFITSVVNSPEILEDVINEIQEVEKEIKELED